MIGLLARGIVAIIITSIQFAKAFIVKISELFTTRSGRMRLLCLYLPIVVFVLIVSNEQTGAFLNEYGFVIGDLLGVDRKLLENSVIVPFPKNIVFWLLMLLPVYIFYIPSLILSLKSTKKIIKTIGILLPISLYICFCFFIEYIPKILIFEIFLTFVFNCCLAIDYKERINEGTYKSTILFKDIIEEHNFISCFFGFFYGLYITFCLCALVYFGIKAIIDKNENVINTLSLIIPILVIVIGAFILYKILKKSNNRDYDDQETYTKNKSEWKEFEETYKDMTKKYQKSEEYIRLEKLETEIKKNIKLCQKTQKLKIINNFVRQKLKSSCQQYNKVREYIVSNHIKDRGYQINESKYAYRYDDYGNLITFYRHSDGELYDFEEIVL